ncbi:hypothetical protein OS493_024043 [Desmophyllum pertusum]|uniref:Uncharacterized protein n=1 Tax=Desmophyllum pertusum TaxID=174260 RepID=A0A9X0D408_9CNID|nr:hypothetical protein OS493_024043 [Desmophyllum pertusum]
MVKPKRSSLCPGCKTPKNNHAFAAPSKHCARPKHEMPADNAEDVVSEDGASPPYHDIASPPAASVSQAQPTMQQSLLDAMQNLSLQLEGLTKEQAVIKKGIDVISAGNAPKTTHETSPVPSSSSDNVPPVNCANKTHHLLEKFATAAVSGEYVDFSDVLSSLLKLINNSSS